MVELITQPNIMRGEGAIPDGAYIVVVGQNIDSSTGRRPFYLVPVENLDERYEANNVVNRTAAPVYANEHAPLIRVTSTNPATYYVRNNDTRVYDPLPLGGALTGPEIVALLRGLPADQKLVFTDIEGNLPASRITGLPPGGGFMTAQAVITALEDLDNAEKATLSILKTDGNVSYQQTNSINTNTTFRYNIPMSLSFPAIPDLPNQSRSITVPIAAVINNLDGWTVTVTASNRTYTVNNLNPNSEVENIAIVVEEA